MRLEMSVASKLVKIDRGKGLMWRMTLADVNDVDFRERVAKKRL